jgi:hypothetical protein
MSLPLLGRRAALLGQVMQLLRRDHVLARIAQVARRVLALIVPIPLLG